MGIKTLTKIVGILALLVFILLGIVVFKNSKFNLFSTNTPKSDEFILQDYLDEQTSIDSARNRINNITKASKIFDTEYQQKIKKIDLSNKHEKAIINNTNSNDSLRGISTRFIERYYSRQ